MQTFITGTSGYLGRHLMATLEAKGMNVIAINRRNMPDSIMYEEFNTINYHEKNILIHCAGLAHSKLSKYSSFYEANVCLSKNLAFKALKNKFSKFIYVSSIGVLGNSEGELNALTTPNPYDAYTTSKYEAELELKSIFRDSDCELVIIRPPLIVGKNAPGNIRAIEGLLFRLPITPFKSISNKKSIITIDSLCTFLSNPQDLVAGIYMPTEKNPISTPEIFDMVADFHNKRFYHLPIPKRVICTILKLLNKSEIENTLLGDLVIKN